MTLIHFTHLFLFSLYATFVTVGACGKGVHRGVDSKRSQDVLEQGEGVVEVAEKAAATGKEVVLDLVQELENTKAVSSVAILLFV